MIDKVEKSVEHNSGHSDNTEEAFKPRIREDGGIYAADFNLTVNHLVNKVPEGIDTIPTPILETYISDAISFVKYITNGMVNSTGSLLRSKVASSIDSIIHSGFPALSNYPVISDLNWLYPIFKSLIDSGNIINKIKIAMGQAALFVARLPLTTTGRGLVSTYFQHLKLLLPTATYAILDAIGEYSEIFSSWLSCIPGFEGLDVGDLCVVWLSLLVWSLSLNADSVTRLKTSLGKTLQTAYDMTNWVPTFFGWLGLLNSPAAPAQLNDSEGQDVSVRGDERDSFASTPHEDSNELKESFSWLPKFVNSLRDPLKFPTAMATDQQPNDSQVDNSAMQQKETIENSEKHINQSIDHFIYALRSPETTGTLNGLSLEAMNKLKSDLLKGIDFNKELSFRMRYHDTDLMIFSFDFTGRDVSDNIVTRSVSRSEMVRLFVKKVGESEPTIVKFLDDFTAHIIQLNTYVNGSNAFEKHFAPKPDNEFDTSKMYNIVSEDQLTFLKENPDISSLSKEEVYFSPGNLFAYKKEAEKIASALLKVKKIFQFSIYGSFKPESLLKYNGLTAAEVDDFMSATHTHIDWGSEFNLELQCIDQGYNFNIYGKDKSSGRYKEVTLTSEHNFNSRQPGYKNVKKVWTTIKHLLREALPSQSNRNKSVIINDTGLIKLAKQSMHSAKDKIVGGALDRENLDVLLQMEANGLAGKLFTRNSNTTEGVVYRGGHNFNVGVDNFGNQKPFEYHSVLLNSVSEKNIEDFSPEIRDFLKSRLGAILEKERESIILYLLENQISMKEYPFFEERYMKEIIIAGGFDINLELELSSLYSDGTRIDSPVLNVKHNFNPQGKTNFDEFLKDVIDNVLVLVNLGSADDKFKPRSPSSVFGYINSSSVEAHLVVRFPRIKTHGYIMSDKYAEAFGLYDYNKKNRASGFVPPSLQHKGLVQKITSELKESHNVVSKSSTIQAATTLLHGSSNGRSRDLIEKDVVGEYYKLLADQINLLQEKKLHEIEFQRAFILHSLMGYLNIDKSKYQALSSLKIGVARESSGGDKPYNRDVSFLELIFNDGLRKAVGVSGLHPLYIRHFHLPTSSFASKFKNTGRFLSGIAGYTWNESSAEVIAEFLIDAGVAHDNDKANLTEKLGNLFVTTIDTDKVPAAIAKPVENFKEHIHSEIDFKVNEISVLEAEKILLLSRDAQNRIFQGNINYFQNDMTIDAKAVLTSEELTALTNKMDVLRENLKRFHDNTPINFYNDLDVWKFKDYKDLFVQLLHMLPYPPFMVAAIINDISSGAGVEQIAEDFIFLVIPFLEEFRALEVRQIGALINDVMQAKILADSIMQTVKAWKEGNFEELSSSVLGVAMSGHGLLMSGIRLAMPRKFEMPYIAHDINGQKFVVTSDVSERVSSDGNDKPIIRKGGLIKSSDTTSSGTMTFFDEWAVDKEQAKGTYECERIQLRSRRRRGLESCLVIKNAALSSIDFDTSTNPLPAEGSFRPLDREFHPWGAEWKISATKVEAMVNGQSQSAFVVPYEGRFVSADERFSGDGPKILTNDELSKFKLPKVPSLYPEVEPELLYQRGLSGHVKINRFEKNLPNSEATLPISILPRRQAEQARTVVGNRRNNNNQRQQVTEDLVMNYGKNWYYGTRIQGGSEATTTGKMKMKMKMKKDSQLTPEEREAQKIHSMLMSGSFHRNKLTRDSFKELVSALDSHSVAQGGDVKAPLHDIRLSAGERYLFDKEYRVTLQKMHREQGGSVWESYDSKNFTPDDVNAMNYNKDIMEALYPDIPDFDTTKSAYSKKGFLNGKNYVLFTVGDESFLVLSGSRLDEQFTPKVFMDTKVNGRIPNIKVSVELSGKNDPTSKGKKHSVTFVNLDPELRKKMNALNKNPEYPPSLPTAATPEQLGEPVGKFQATATRKNDSERMLAAFLASSKVIERGEDLFVFNRNDACKSCAAMLETLFEKARAAGTTTIRHVFVIPYDKY